MKKSDFLKIAKTAADANDDATDPLVFVKSERNEDGKWESFYRDSSNMYFISEDGTFNYASAL